MSTITQMNTAKNQARSNRSRVGTAAGGEIPLDKFGRSRPGNGRDAGVVLPTELQFTHHRPGG